MSRKRAHSSKTTPIEIEPIEIKRRPQQTRREALSGLAAGVAAVGCSGGSSAGQAPEMQTPGQAPSQAVEPKAATDLVPLGNTGINVSRLAIGSGSFGGSGTSDQTKLGVEQFASLLVQSYDRGITFWETADMYGAHEHVGEGMRQVGRQNVVLMTKTIARTAEQMEADLLRFQQELGTDYIDIMLLHQCESETWTTEREGAMQVLADAKERGVIRAHGVSCHTLQAQQLAARTEWVDVDLARINPFGLHMDAAPEVVIPVLDDVKASGTGVIGMKILALGQAFTMGRFDEAIAHAVSLSCLDCFTIGFMDTTQLDEVTAKITSVQQFG